MKKRKPAVAVLGRYRVRDFRAGKKIKHGVVDTVTRRWVNLCWSDKDQALQYANDLNKRATSVPATPLAGVAY